MEQPAAGTIWLAQPVLQPIEVVPPRPSPRRALYSKRRSPNSRPLNAIGGSPLISNAAMQQRLAEEAAARQRAIEPRGAPRSYVWRKRPAAPRKHVYGKRPAAPRSANLAEEARRAEEARLAEEVHQAEEHRPHRLGRAPQRAPQRTLRLHL